MKKNITVIGTGYVGLVSAVGLADLGHEVTAMDLDRYRIRDLKKGYLPYYEPGLKNLLKKTLTGGKIHFTCDYEEASEKSDTVIVAVGTPSSEDGSVDLSQIRNAFDMIIENLHSSKTIIIKSTVPPGTTSSMQKQFSVELENTGSDLVFCPEFLREGTAVHDFYHPDRIVIGSESHGAFKTVEGIFYPVSRDVPVLKCGSISAEMIKYGSNVMLASRLAAVNELAELSEKLGSDIGEITSGIGLDRRIGTDFLKAGPGFGGSCFGKDVAGLVIKSKEIGVEMPHIGEIIKSNNHQKIRPAAKLEKLLGTLKGKKIAVLGLAFKADTDDVRGSAAFEVINYLIEKKAVVKAHDPRAEYNFIRDFKKKGYSCVENAADALSRADAAVILTDWDEYSKLTPEIMSTLMHGRVIVDARNMFDEQAFRHNGFTYHGTGRPAAVAKTRKKSEFVNAAIVSM